MKIYTQTFDLAQPMSKMISVAKNSEFGIGIKIVKNGAEVEDEFTVEANGEILTPEDDKISGFTIYLLNTGDTDVTFTITCNGQTFKLTQNTIESSVFEKSFGGDSSGGIVGTGFLDFSEVSSIPTASTTLFMTDSGADYQIIVPDSLYTSWKTNPFWYGVADKIVSASDYIVVMSSTGGKDSPNE